MFCVIQEIETKKVSCGEPKEIEVYESSWSMNGENRISYRFRYSEERFERPIKKAFKISIHESYRENGKVKKHQTVICTMPYYDIIDYGLWVGDYVCGGLSSKSEALGITEEKLEKMIYEKFQPIIDKVKAEFEGTEEYRAKKQHKDIINRHNERVETFKKKYEVDSDEYDRCYDVFGKLRNPEYLDKIKREYKQRKEYEEKSRSYREDFYSNYFKGSFGGGSSYFDSGLGNYTDEDRETLKQFYRTLSKKFHPDANPDTDTSKQMQLLNKLKGEWGL